MKDVLKIVLFKQILIPFITIVLMVIFLPKITVALSTDTGSDSGSVASTFLISVFAVILFIWYIWLPYTCVKIWRISQGIAQGWKRGIAKTYSGVLLALIILPCLYWIPKLPSLYQKLEAAQAETISESKTKLAALHIISNTV